MQRDGSDRVRNQDCCGDWLQELQDDLGGAGDGVGGGIGDELAADLGEVGDLAGAGGGVFEQGRQGRGEGVGVEVLLEQLGDDAAAGDEVHHRDGEVAVVVLLGGDLGGVLDEALGEGEGEGGHPVDDDEGVADDRGLDGGGAAGDDGGAGVVEGLAGVGDEVEVGEWGGGRGLAGLEGDPAGDELAEALGVDGVGDGEDVLAVARGGGGPSRPWWGGWR